MNPIHMLANAVQRRLEDIFPGQFRSQWAKHHHGKDFGWPDRLTFDMLYGMYRRNGLAAAGVDRTIAKTWQDYPDIWETEKPPESSDEQGIRQRFTDLRLWQMMAEADRRSMVGRYGALILRFRDNQALDKPVDRVPGGLDGLAGVIPAWESQLIVSQWVNDSAREDYGQPSMFQFQEAAVDGAGPGRSFKVHPDRVLILSDDGTVNGRSALESGFNDLLDAEKVKGAGGEGFWKTSRGAPVIEAANGMSPADIARNMGVEPTEVLDEINGQIENFMSGFDKGLILGGMTAKPLQITLPSPEHFFAIAVGGFAASIQMPVKILLGSQTGERASTEDAREWSMTCNARRVNRCKPVIAEMIQRLKRVGILPERDWFVGWQDLTEATGTEKMARAKEMSAINAQSVPGDELPFSANEIREAAGFDPLGEADE